MSEPTDYDIVQAMQTFGGSFVQKLAVAYQFADSTNRARLTAAFPEYWARYRELARMKAARATNAPAAVDPQADSQLDTPTREKGI